MFTNYIKLGELIAALNLIQAKEALKQTQQQESELQSMQSANVPKRHFGSNITQKYQKAIVEYNVNLQRAKEENLPKLQKQASELKSFISTEETREQYEHDFEKGYKLGTRKGVMFIPTKSMGKAFLEGYDAGRERLEYSEARKKFFSSIKEFNETNPTEKITLNYYNINKPTIESGALGKTFSSFEEYNKAIENYNQSIYEYAAKNNLMSIRTKTPLELIMANTQNIKPYKPLTNVPFINKAVEVVINDYQAFKNIPLIKNTLYNQELLRIGYGVGIGIGGGTVSVSKITGEINKAVPHSEIITDFIPKTPIGAGTFVGVGGIMSKSKFLLDLGRVAFGTISASQIIGGIETGDTEKIEKGIVGLGLMGLGESLAYLKKPILLKVDEKMSINLAKEDINQILIGERNINTGKYTIAKFYPERNAFYASRGEILLKKLSLLKLDTKPISEMSFEELESIYDISGKKVKLSEAKLILAKTDVGIIDEGEIIGSARSGGKEPLKIYIQSGTLKRKEPIIESILTGKMESSKDLSKIDLLNLDKPTKKALLEIFNQQEQKNVKINIETDLINQDKILSQLDIVKKTRGLDFAERQESPISVSGGEVEIKSYKKILRNKKKITKEINIETDLINQDKIMSKIIASKSTKEIPINDILKGKLTSVQKSLGGIEYEKEYGLIEEEKLISKVAVNEIKEKIIDVLKSERYLGENEVKINKSMREGLLGFYRSKNKDIYLKNKNDVETYIHERTHAVLDKLEITSLNENTKTGFLKETTDLRKRIPKILKKLGYEIEQIPEEAIARLSEEYYKSGITKEGFDKLYAEEFLNKVAKRNPYIAKVGRKIFETPEFKSILDKPDIVSLKAKGINEIEDITSAGKLKASRIGRKTDIINVMSDVKTYRLEEPNMEIGTRQVIQKKPFESKYGAKSVDEVLKDAGLKQKTEVKQIPRKDLTSAGKKIIAGAELKLSKMPSPRVSYPKLKETPMSKGLVNLNNIEKEISREVSRPMSKDISKEMNKYISKEIPREITKSISKEVPREMPREITKEMPREILKEVTKQVPKLITKIIPKEEPKTGKLILPPRIPKDNVSKTILAKKGSNKKIYSKKSKKKAKGEVFIYTPDLTSLTFNIKEKVRAKDLKSFIKNPPELRGLLQVTR